MSSFINPNDYNQKVINHSWGAKEIIQTQKEGNQLNVQVFYQSPWQTLKTYISNVFYNITHPFQTSRTQQHSEKYIALIGKPLAQRKFTIRKAGLLDSTKTEIDRQLSEALQRRSFNESKKNELEAILQRIEKILPELESKQGDPVSDEDSSTNKPFSPKTPVATPRSIESPKAEPQTPSPRLHVDTSKAAQQKPQATPVTPKSTPAQLSPNLTKPEITDKDASAQVSAPSSIQSQAVRDSITNTTDIKYGDDSQLTIEAPKPKDEFGRVKISDVDSDDEEDFQKQNEGEGFQRLTEDDDLQDLNSRNQNSSEGESTDLSQNQSSLLQDQSKPDEAAAAQTKEQLAQQAQALEASNVEVERLEAAKRTLNATQTASDIGTNALTASTDVNGVEKPSTPELTQEQIVTQFNDLHKNLLNAQFSESLFIYFADWQGANVELLNKKDLSAENLRALNASFNQLKDTLKSLCFEECSSISKNPTQTAEKLASESATKINDEKNRQTASARSALRTLISEGVNKATLDLIIKQKQAINPIIAQDKVVAEILTPVQTRSLFLKQSNQPVTFASAMMRSKDLLNSTLKELQKINSSFTFNSQLDNVQQLVDAINHAKTFIKPSVVNFENESQLQSVYDKIIALDSTISLLISTHNNFIGEKNKSIGQENLFPSLLKPFALNDLLWNSSTAITAEALQSGLQRVENVLASTPELVKLDDLFKTFNSQITNSQGFLDSKGELLKRLGTSKEALIADFQKEAQKLMPTNLDLTKIRRDQEALKNLTNKFESVKRNLISIEQNLTSIDSLTTKIDAQIATLKNQKQTQLVERLEKEVAAIKNSYVNNDWKTDNFSENTKKIEAARVKFSDLLTSVGVGSKISFSTLQNINLAKEDFQNKLLVAETFINDYFEWKDLDSSTVSKIRFSEEIVGLREQLKNLDNPNSLSILGSIRPKGSILDLSPDQLSNYKLKVEQQITALGNTKLALGNSLNEILALIPYFKATREFQQLIQENISNLKNANPPQLVAALKLQKTLDDQFKDLNQTNIRLLQDSGKLSALQTAAITSNAPQTLLEQLESAEFKLLSAEDKKTLEKLFYAGLQTNVDEHINYLENDKKLLVNLSPYFEKTYLETIQENIENTIRSLHDSRSGYTKPGSYFKLTRTSTINLHSTALGHDDLINYGKALLAKIKLIDDNTLLRADTDTLPNDLHQLDRLTQKSQALLSEANTSADKLRSISTKQNVKDQLETLNSVLTSKVSDQTQLTAKIQNLNHQEKEIRKLFEKARKTDASKSALEEFISFNGGLETSEGLALYNELSQTAVKKIDDYISEIEQNRADYKAFAENYEIHASLKPQIDAQFNDAISAATNLRKALTELDKPNAADLVSMPATRAEEVRKVKIKNFYETQKFELINKLKQVDKFYSKEINGNSNTLYGFHSSKFLSKLNNFVNIFNGLNVSVNGAKLSPALKKEFDEVTKHVIPFIELILENLESLDNIDSATNLLEQASNYIDQAAYNIKVNIPLGFNIWTEINSLENSGMNDLAVKAAVAPQIQALLNGTDSNSLSIYQIGSKLWPQIAESRNLFALKHSNDYSFNEIASNIMSNSYGDPRSVAKEVGIAISKRFGNSYNLNEFIPTVAYATFSAYMQLTSMILAKSKRQPTPFDEMQGYKVAGEVILNKIKGNNKPATEQDYINVGLAIAYCYCQHVEGISFEESAEKIATIVSQLLSSLGCTTDIAKKAAGVAAGYTYHYRAVKTEAEDEQKPDAAWSVVVYALTKLKVAKSIIDEAASIAASAVVEKQIFDKGDANPSITIPTIVKGVMDILYTRIGLTPGMPNPINVAEAIKLELVRDNVEAHDVDKIDEIINSVLKQMNFVPVANTAGSASKGSILGNINGLIGHLTAIEGLLTPAKVGRGDINAIYEEMQSLKRQIEDLNREVATIKTSEELQKFMIKCIYKCNNVSNEVLKLSRSPDLASVGVSFPPNPKLSWPLLTTNQDVQVKPLASAYAPRGTTSSGRGGLKLEVKGGNDSDYE